MRDAFFALAEQLSPEQEASTPPAWALQNDFRLGRESLLEAEVISIASQIDALFLQREAKRREIEDEVSLRALLFEKGPRLERAVREALTILGFDAQHFRDSTSEFDAVFSSSEGRFLGEVEGRDTKSISIDKFSQLERNISEDFSREGVTAFAQPVLFGNTFRNTMPSERGSFFTEKVLQAAQRSGACLVRTPDLFEVARYVRESGDDDFARLCRQTMRDVKGEIALFPEIPSSI